MDITRLPQIAKLLLGDFLLADSDRGWLQTRLDHGDWVAEDAVRFHEMLPRSLHWLLVEGEQP